MYEIIVQRACENRSIPTTAKLKNWAKLVLKKRMSAGELTLRVVGKNEITHLNSTYRHKNKPTNVLSFPFEAPADIKLELPILGDIVFCADVIQEEARDQQKKLEAHWAHMVVHGILHLLGYDHEKDRDAEKMESEEIAILKTLGFDNPYQINEKGER